MKNPNVLANISGSDLLAMLGLESKPTNLRRVATYAGVAVAGIAVGAVIAALLTPKSGRQLRTDLRTGARDLTQSASSTAQGAFDAARRKAAEITSPLSQPAERT